MIRDCDKISIDTRQENGNALHAHTLTATTICRLFEGANAEGLKLLITMDPALLIPPIPYDLLGPIFEHLQGHTASLCAISLTSSSFRNEAQRILFRDVTTLEMYRNHIKFLRIVAASPNRLALFVHAYRQFWPIDTPTEEEFAKVLPKVVGDGLKAMCCLKQLDITFCATLSSSHHAYVQILSACKFRLERFNWVVQQRTSDELVERFLSNQPTLRHLGLMYNACMADPLGLVPSTCPRLVCVTAGWPMIKALLPARKITTLAIKDWNIDITDANIKPLAAELKCIKALSISFLDLRKMDVLDHGILKYFPSLSVLEIYNMHYDDTEDTRYTPLEVPELLRIVSKLPALQILILTDLPYERDRREDIGLTRPIFSNFGKHLTCIDIKTRWKLYARYMQSPETIQFISEDKVRSLWLETS